MADSYVPAHDKVMGGGAQTQTQAVWQGDAPTLHYSLLQNMMQLNLILCPRDK